MKHFWLCKLRVLKKETFATLPLLVYCYRRIRVGKLFIYALRVRNYDQKVFIILGTVQSTFVLQNVAEELPRTRIRART